MIAFFFSSNMASFFLINFCRTYAVGVLNLRQSGTFLFNCVPFSRAERGKTAHRGSARTMLPQAKSTAARIHPGAGIGVRWLVARWPPKCAGHFGKGLCHAQQM